MKKLHKTQAVLIIASLSAASIAFAGGDFSSTLNNKSKMNGSEGYYLVKDTTWGEHGCIVENGKDRINPGESATLKIKSDCKWAGVRYKIFSVNGKKEMGNVGHSFHDGDFSVEMSSPCKGKECNFYDLSPEQNGRK